MTLDWLANKSQGSIRSQAAQCWNYRLVPGFFSDVGSNAQVLMLIQ